MNYIWNRNKKFVGLATYCWLPSGGITRENLFPNISVGVCLLLCTLNFREILEIFFCAKLKLVKIHENIFTEVLTYYLPIFSKTFPQFCFLFLSHLYSISFVLHLLTIFTRTIVLHLTSVFIIIKGNRSTNRRK